MKKIEKLDIDEEMLKQYAKSYGMPLIVVLQGIGELTLKVNELVEAVNELAQKEK